MHRVISSSTAYTSSSSAALHYLTDAIVLTNFHQSEAARALAAASYHAFVKLLELTTVKIRKGKIQTDVALIRNAEM